MRSSHLQSGIDDEQSCRRLYVIVLCEGGIHAIAREPAKRAGLVPQQDLQILGVGGGPGMIAALENGQVDVACNTSPTTDLMVKRGKAIMFTHNSLGRDPAYDDFLFESTFSFIAPSSALGILTVAQHAALDLACCGLG